MNTDWESIWASFGDTVPWQITGPHQVLVRNIEALTGGKDDQRILVPLCGMSYDLVWLADQGHKVVGVERVTSAIEGFFKKNRLEYEISVINLAPSGVYIYKAKTKNITILQCDVFHVKKSAAWGDFDAVWDRAALIAMVGNGHVADVATGKKYLKVLRDVLAPGGRVLIETILYDPEERQGNPGPALLKDETLKAICDKEWKMKRVELSSMKPGDYFQNFTFPYHSDVSVHLLTPN